jgi:hypothetical protein
MSIPAENTYSLMSEFVQTLRVGYDVLVLSLIKSTIAHVYIKLGYNTEPKRVYDELFQYPYLKENAESISADFPFETLEKVIQDFRQTPSSSIYFSGYGGAFVDPLIDKPSATYH